MSTIKNLHVGLTRPNLIFPRAFESWFMNIWTRHHYNDYFYLFQFKIFQSPIYIKIKSDLIITFLIFKIYTHFQALNTILH